MHDLYFFGTAQGNTRFWIPQRSTANSRRIAVTMPNWPRLTSNERCCWKWQLLGRGWRKRQRNSNAKSRTSLSRPPDLHCDPFWSRLFVPRLALLPFARKLRAVAGMFYFQALSSEAPIFVRPAHSEQPRYDHVSQRGRTASGFLKSGPNRVPNVTFSAEEAVKFNVADEDSRQADSMGVARRPMYYALSSCVLAGTCISFPAL